MRIAFLCVANSARSQMAEGLARAQAPDGFDIYSAGSEPTSVRPEAIDALNEIGIACSEAFSKGIDEIPLTAMDLVITLCADEVCPMLPAEVTHRHWPLPDPAAVSDPEARMAAFRDVRDMLQVKLRKLFADLRTLR
jgi:arsenate reductase